MENLFLNQRLVYNTEYLKNKMPLTVAAATNPAKEGILSKATVPLLPAAMAADALKMEKDAAKWILEKTNIVNRTRSKISDVYDFTKSGIKEGGARTLRLGRDLIFNPLVKEPSRLAYNTSIIGLNVMRHLPSDMYKIVNGTRKKALGLLTKIPGFLSNKIKKYSEDGFKSGAEDFAGINFRSAPMNLFDATRNSSIAYFNSIAKTVPNVALGEDNQLTNAINQMSHSLDETNVFDIIAQTGDKFRETMALKRFV
ncbi:MAG: hypothetical protein N4A36_04200 [Candidatus Gracilibacteria bacterium]|jgi:hypothetical protein|nr:hypothetical protein [Candidatus Gracilibacteria bacterium]